MKRTAIAVLAVAGVLLAAGPAAAVPPARSTFSFSFQDVTDALCGFDLELSVEGGGTITRFFDRQGNLIRIQIHASDDALVRNPANDKSASGHEAWTTTIDVVKGTETTVGLPIHLNVPGHGAVVMDAGRVVFDENGVPTFVAGPHQVLEGDFSELCAALA